MSPNPADPVPEIRVIGLRRCSRGALLGGTALRAAALVVLATQAKAQLASGAHPSGGVVVGGSASIVQNGSTTDITQKSGRAAIDWQSFNVGSGAKVVFAQPSSSSVALNTIVGPNPSEIAGRITANGVVAIVNQAGVIFDQGSQVDTAGLIVSAAGISRQNFMAGHMVFDQAPHPGASVVNNGAITIQQAGLAALVAPQVVNNGVITARLGRVILGGATTYTLDLYGDGLLALNVTGQVTQVTLGGRTMPALVTNAGTILADGGTVVLNASAADGLIRTLVEAGGSISASSVGSQAGRVLVQGIGGSVDISGAVSATGASPGTVGGTIVANATGTVSLAPTASLDASGANGGGLIAIGTTAARARSRSAHATLTAQAVDVAAGATIAANALTSGNGGHVTLLSTSQTSLGGVITVQGGAFGGNGGMAEVSGDFVSLPGSVNALAPEGATGGLLIDPLGIVISDSTPAGIAPAMHFTPAELQTAGAAANVTLTTHSTTTSGTIFGGPVGDIDFAYSGPVAGPIHNTLALPNGLTVLADGNINIDTGFTITGGSISMTASAGAITFDSMVGAGLFHVTASSASAILSGSAVTMQASTGIALAGAAITGTTSISLSATAGSIAGTGVLTTPSLTGTASAGITLTGSNAITATGAIDTTGGNITIDNAGALTIGGPLTSAGNITLSSGALTINNAVATDSASQPPSGTLSITVTSGGLAEQAGGIVTGTLTGTVAGTADFFSTNNTFPTLGAFAVTGAGSSLFIYDHGALAVTGAASAGGGQGLFIDLLDSGKTLSVAPVTGSLAAGGGSDIQLGADAFALSGSVSTTGLVAFGRTSAGALDVGGASTSFGVPGLTSVTAGTLVFGSVNGTSADVHTTSLGISQSLGSSTQTIILDSSGGITEGAGAVITAKLLEGSAANNTALTDANEIGSLGAFSTTGTGGFQLTDGQTMDVTGPVTSAGAIILQADAFVISGSVSTTGLVALARNSSGALTYTGSPGDSFGDANFANITAGTLALGSLDGVTAASTTSSIAIAGNLTLPSTVTTLGLFASGAASAITITGGLTVPDALEAFTAGALNAGAGISVNAGTLTGHVGTAAFSNTETIGTLQNFTVDTGGLTLTDLGTLIIAGNVAATDAALVLNAGGDITERTAGVLSGSITATSLTGSATGSIDLGDSANAFGTIATQLIATGGPLVVKNLDPLDVNGVVTSGAGLTLSTIGGTNALVLNATAALTANGVLSLNAAGALTEDPAATISATSLTGSAGGSVSLIGGNAFGTLGSLSAGGALTLDDGQALSVTGSVSAADALTIKVSTSTLSIGAAAGITGASVTLESTDQLTELSGGSITATSGNASLTSDTAGIGFGGTLSAPSGTLQFNALHGTVVESANLDAGTLDAASVAGTAQVIALTGTNAVGTLTNLDATAGGLTIDEAPASATPTIAVTGTLSSTSTIDVTLSGSASTLTLGGVLNAATVELTAPAGIGQTSGGITATTLTAVSSGGAVSLLSSGNQVETLGLSGASTSFAFADSGTSAGAYDGTLTESGSVTVGNSGTLALSAPTLTINGSLAAPGGIISLAADTLSLNASVDAGSGIVGIDTFSDHTLTFVAGALADISAGELALGSPNGTIVSSNVTSIAISSALTLSSTPTLGLFTRSGGTVTDSSGITVSTLVGNAGTVTITGPNSITSLGSFTAGTLSLTEAGNLDVTGPVTATAAMLSAGTLQIPGSVTGSGTLVLIATNGTISETGALTTALLTGSATGSAALTGSNSVTAVGAFSADGLTLIDGTDLSITGSVGSGAGALSLTTTAGFNLDITGSLTTSAPMTLSAGGAIGEAGGTLIADGLTGSAGTTADLSGTNDVRTLGNFTAGTSLTLHDIGALSVAGTVTSPITALNATSIDITSSALVTATTSLALTATAGEITEEGTISALTLTGSSGTSAALLTGSNTITNLGDFVSNGFTFDQSSGLTITGNVQAGSSASFIVGTLAESGSISVTTLTGVVTGDANLAGTTNSITLLGSFTAGTLSLTDAGNLDVTGPVTATATTLSAATLQIPGSVTGNSTLVLIATNGITESGTLTAGTLTGSATTSADLSGANSNANSIGTLGGFTAESLTLDDGAAVLATAGAVTISGALSLTATALSIGGDVSAGSAFLSATGGTIAGAISVAGSLTGNSAGSTGLSGSINSLGSFTAAGFALNDTGALSVTGTVTSPITALTATSIDITSSALITAATSLALTGTAGEITEEGAIAAGILTGSSGSFAAGFTGSNTITTLGGFVANGFSLKDTGALSVTGPVSGGGNLSIASAGALTISGGVTATNVSLTGLSILISANGLSTSGSVGASSLILSAVGDATPGDGTIFEDAKGAITATILSGSAHGSASLVGTNAISTLTAFSAAPLTVDDTSSLTIQGSVTGSYTPQGGSPVFGAVMLDLPTKALTITGTLNAETEALSITAGSVTETLTGSPTGTVIAASLTGTTTGATSLTSTFNAISDLGSYTAASFTLGDSVTLLSVNGPVVATDPSGTVSLSNVGTGMASGNLQVGGAVTGTTITLHADQQLALATGAVLTATDVDLSAGYAPNTGGLSEDPSAGIGATTLTGTIQGAASLIGANSIATLGSFTATGGLTLDDATPLTIASGPGTIVSAPTVTLTAANLTIDGLIDATTSLSLTATDASPAGTIAEVATAALQTPLLALVAQGTVSLLGTANLIGATTTSGVGNLDLVDAEDLSVTGSLASSNGVTITDAGHTVTVAGSIEGTDTNLSAGDIAIPGLIDTGTLELAASAAGGTISAPGTLIAASVSGSASGSASLVSTTDANQIGTLGGFSAAGFALNDSTALSITGTVNGTTTTGITADGLLTIGGSIAGANTTLTGDGIVLTGTLTATDLALSAGSSITGTGSASITATSLTGSAAAAVLLTGTNTITNLGSFTATGFTLDDTGLLTVGGPLQGGPTVAIDDQAGVTITGSVAATSTTLTAMSLDVPGTITAGTLALSIHGTLTETQTGIIDAGLLEGSVTGSAAFAGTNTIGTLGAFTAAGLTFDDTTDIVIAGPVVSGATTLTAADIDIPGKLTATNLVATSTAGTIAEGGTLTVTGTLSGSAVGSAAFTGSNSNSIAAIAGFTAAGLTLDDQQDVVVGAVDGQASVAITDAGLITVQGALTGTATSLTAAALDVPGSIAAAGSLTLSIGGTIAEGGSIATPLLTGSATGSAVFSGTNEIDALGPFTAAGLVVSDTQDLTIDGPVNGGASAVITAATIDIPGTISASTLALTATTGGVTEAGSITAGTLTGTAATSAAFTGSNTVGTLGDFTAPTGFVLDDTPGLAVAGAVSGGPAVTITDAGVLTVTGSITGSTTTLTASSINILDPAQTPGAIDAATSLELTATSGTMTETGSISTALLSGSATGDATLTGTNSITNLGSFTAANLALADSSALTVTGSVTAATIALTPAALTITGTLDAPTELQVTTAGDFSSTGTLITGLLVGTVTGDATLIGTDLISTLGAFSANAFTLLDESALTVTGPVVGTTNLAITAATIDIPGSVTATSASLTSSGSLTETGSIVAGTLALSAGGSASLTGSNSIATLANLTAAGLTLDDNAALTVNGTVDGQTSVVFNDAAALSIAGTGSITGSTTALTAASMTIAGTIDAGTSLALTTPGSGSIGETGSITTAHMTGSAGGNASFTGANQILAVGDFSTGGGFVLNDASVLSLDGMLNAVGGNIAITTAGNVTQTASAVTVTGILGDAATVGTITMATTGTITLAGLTDAPTILIGDTEGTPSEVVWTGNTVVTGSSVRPAAHHPAFPATNGSKPGVFVLTDKFAQTGTTHINPKGRASVIDITLAKRGGTVNFDPSYGAGLVAPGGELFLNLKFGTAAGHIDVAGLSVEFALPGSNSLTDLDGTIDGETGPAAAGAAYIVQPNSEYRFNSCPIQSINCILVSPVIVPITNPVEDVEVTTPRRRRDDDDLIIPNVGEQDF